MILPLDRRDAARALAQHFEKVWASPYAQGVRRPAPAEAPPEPPRLVAAPAPPPEPSDHGALWRTVANRPNRCADCNGQIPPTSRFLYDAGQRTVVCRECAGDDRWQEARPSKALREFAKRRRFEQGLAA